MKTDDPNLTAFALDEMEASERPAVEAHLRADPLAAAEVAGVRELSGLLRKTLAGEPATGLDASRRAELLAAAGDAGCLHFPAHELAPRRRSVWLPAALAATVIVGACYGLLFSLGHVRGPSRLADFTMGDDEIPVAVGVVEAPGTFAPPPAMGQILPDIRIGATPAPVLLTDASETKRLADEFAQNVPTAISPVLSTAGKVALITEKMASQEKSLSQDRATSVKSFSSGSTRAGGWSGQLVISPSASTATAANTSQTMPVTTSLGVVDGFRGEQSQLANHESYEGVADNPFLAVREKPLSTFSIDVDTGSYSNVRRFLQAGQRPPREAVRIEELVNYFPYAYPAPKPGEPFSVNMEVASCPWSPEHRLLRVGLKAREIPREERPSANLVFLIDVSGSMQPQNKLPLVKESLRLLVEQLGPQDSVGIVVYAGETGVMLEPTNDKAAIRATLERLGAGGSTNGASGLQAAYQLARRSFVKEKTNRVILATDGDFNVGITDQSDLVRLIESEAKSGVFLTVLGFGYGNLKDSTLEKLADKGNGNYAYIDTLGEGRRVLVEQVAGTLITVAKDVKLQIEFNPAQVSSYRLIGYENRLLRKEDFHDDTKDAGEIGAGHTVTALYELVPARAAQPALTKVDPLKYQPAPPAVNKPSLGGNNVAAQRPTAADPFSEELLTLKLRWKAPDSDISALREFPLRDQQIAWAAGSPDFRWAAAVAGFGMLLRDSPHKGDATWQTVLELAEQARGEDPGGYRSEFRTLVMKAMALAR